MGCDIHLFVEFRVTLPNGSMSGWFGTGEQMRPGRDYRAFANIANVRGTGLFEPKGMPDDVSFEARDANTFFVQEDGKPLEESRYVHRSDAEKWVANGSSEWCDPHSAAKGEPPKWVTDPDAHSHTWLSRDEWQAVLEESHSSEPYPVTYFVIGAMLDEYAARGCEARVVCWFDC